MQKTVIFDEVEIRNGSPERLSTNKKGLIFKNFAIEVSETVQGENIDGNSVWYKDKNGDFYWSGGFEQEADIESDIAINVDSINYSELLGGIQELAEYQHSDCSEINIAVLDSGVNLQIVDLTSALLPDRSRDFTNTHSLDDADGHGSHVSGIISAHGPNILGTAHNSRFIMHKVMTTNGSVNSNAVRSSLNELLHDNEVRIINMSFNLSVNDYQWVDSLCEQLKNTGKILVAAANEFDSELPNGAFVPAFSEHVISVGVFSERFFDENPTNVHSSFDYLIPKFNFLSTDKSPQNFANRSGSSMNCAFISGLIANFIASDPSLEFEGIKQKLDQVSTKINQVQEYSPILKLYKP